MRVLALLPLFLAIVKYRFVRLFVLFGVEKLHLNTPLADTSGTLFLGGV